MTATFENPHIILLSLAFLVGAVAALVYAIKLELRPVMTDKQWRCFMDERGLGMHRCARCSDRETSASTERESQK